jgi:putative hydrolase of the HAD superfamily
VSAPGNAAGDVLDDVDAVLLDVGGVFYLPDHARVTRPLAALEVAVAAERLDRAHYEGIAAISDHVLVGHHADGSAIWRAYNRAYAAACGVRTADLDAAADALLAEFGRGDVWTREIPGARDALRGLAGRGLALAVVSNADGTVERQLRDDSLCQVGPGAGVEVSAILDSSVVGVAKPDPAIFQIALALLDVPAQRAIHVGDTPSADVTGARAAGVRPVLVDPYDLHTDVDCVRVASLADVLELLPVSRRAL